MTYKAKDNVVLLDIGTKVRKTSPKPFKSGLKINTVKGLNFSADEVGSEAINLTLGWASQAHIKYLEDN